MNVFTDHVHNSGHNASRISLLAAAVTIEIHTARIRGMVLGIERLMVNLPHSMGRQQAKLTNEMPPGRGGAAKPDLIGK